MTEKVRLRARASTSSGNQPRTRSAHSARDSGSPPGLMPASSAGAMYFRTVLGSTPTLDATTDFGRPACQCCRISTTSITSKLLLAMWVSSLSRVTSEVLQDQGARRVDPRPYREPGNSVNDQLGKYLNDSSIS